MLRRLALLVLLLAVPVSAPREAHARGAAALRTDTRLPNGLELSLIVPRGSYPADSLVRVTVRLQNMSRHAVGINTLPGLIAEVDTAGRDRLYPPAFPAMPTTLHADGGIRQIRPGAVLHQAVFVVLRGPRIRPLLGGLAGRAVVVHRIGGGQTPHVTLSGPPDLHAVIDAPGSHRGPLRYTRWSTCTQTGGGELSFETTNIDQFAPVWHLAQGTTVWPAWDNNCSTVQEWHVLAGWEGEPVVAFDWHRPLSPSQPQGTVLSPHSAPASVGVAYPFTLLTHCGIDYFVDFDASLWDLAPTQPGGSIRPSGLGDPFQKGSMTLVDTNTAHFDWSGGRINFIRHPGTKTVPGLCM
jgi:hypothetical protein